MRKIVINLILFVFISLIFLFVILSSIGIETNKFNKLIAERVSKTKKIDLDLETIKFKIDAKQLSLFLETRNPKIKYRGVTIPAQNVKVYINFISLIKSDVKLKKINLILKELDIVQLNKLSLMIKPSNFKSILNNKIKKGKLVSEIEIFINEEGLFKNFIAKGKVKNLEAELIDDLKIRKTNLDFFADQNDILIKNIYGNLEDIKLSNGDIKLNLENGVKLYSNFNSIIDFNEKIISKYSKLFDEFKFLQNFKTLKADLSNNIFIDLDNTYKVKDYNYSISGNIEKSKLELANSLKSSFTQEEFKNNLLFRLANQNNFYSKKY